MGAFAPIGSMNKCEGHDVLAELDNVFSDPNSDRYQYAMQNNIFNSVDSGSDNYRALISAYSEAGVDVCARWGAYLRKLGRSPQGQQDIHDIAQTRYKALKKGIPIKTTVHPSSGGAHVKKHDGSSHGDPSTIDSPFDP